MTESLARNRCVLLTPSGSGAIGVVRVIGPDALSIARTLVSSALPDDADDSCSPNRLNYGILAYNGEVIDDVVVSQACAHGEPAVDICAHGGVRVIERILVALAEQGAELAAIDALGESIWHTSNLIEREADEALVRAKTFRAVRFLAWQRSHLAAALAEISEQACLHPQLARDKLAEACAQFEKSNLLLSGATVVIVGPPNAGKSTLFNRITARPSALVSDIAGTTRDWVSASIEMDGFPITLIDTAGWNDSAEWLERFAIEGGQDIARQCDVCVLVLDASTRIPGNTAAVYRAMATRQRCVVIANKSDIPNRMTAGSLTQALGATPDAILSVSAKTGEGIAEIARQLLRSLGSADFAGRSPTLFTPRQVSAAKTLLSDPEQPIACFQRGISSLVSG